jgi:hypothetical protein
MNHATYGGSDNYLASSSSPAVLNVQARPDFSLTLPKVVTGL